MISAPAMQWRHIFIYADRVLPSFFSIIVHQSPCIMKIKIPLIKPLGLLVATFTLHACVAVSYVGDRYQPTEQVDVYYAERDVESEYRVIGHLSEQVNGLKGEERAKQRIIAKCRDVGADGVIILGFEYGGTKQTEQYQKAQAIKYID